MTAYDRLWSRMPELVDKTAASKSFWRKELPVFEYKDNPALPPRFLVGGMWKPQQEWWDMPEEQWIRVFVGGYGSGKTSILIKRMIILALRNAPAPTAITSPNYTMSKMVLLPSLRTVLEGRRQYTRGAFTYKINLSPPMSIEVYYKGRKGIIFLLSADNPESLKGTNLAAAGMDEPFMQDFSVFEQMVARLRHPDAKQKELVIAGTPEGVSNWGQDLCEGKLFKSYNGQVGVKRASTLDNLATGQQYIDRMLNTYSDDKMREAYIQGEFVNLSAGRIYYGFHRLDNVIDLENYPTGCKFGVGMDFNVNPMAFVVFWYTPNHIHYIKEYELPNADTDFACQTLRDEWPADLISVFPDASGKHRATNAPMGQSDFTILQRYGFRVHAHNANPGRRDRYNATNRMLGTSATYGGNVGITMSKTGCPNLARYFDQYTWEEINKQEHMSHLTDAATYPVAYLFPVKKPTFSIVETFASH